ncbi:DUF4352 domain-containing protein, partial [Candidatus Dojkabacteria bacterium]|nr:DUF4352 domain-containing protein [Candidatus Dojkabacteria bacterium]
MDQAEVTQPIQKSGSNKTIFVVLAIAIILFLCFCCGIFMVMVLVINPASTTYSDNTTIRQELESTPVIENIQRYEDDEVADVEDVDISIVDEIDNYVSEDEFYTPNPEERLVAVQVSMENKSNGNYYFSSYYFNIVDENNFSYQSMYTGSKEPNLESGYLGSDEKVNGWITFEVPV